MNRIADHILTRPQREGETPHYWILRDGEPVPAANLLEFVRWYETDERVLAQTEIAHAVIVSTVFLGINHNYQPGPPILWETMIFRGDGGREQYRWPDKKAAQEGHEALVKQLLAPTN